MVLLGVMLLAAALAQGEAKTDAAPTAAQAAPAAQAGAAAAAAKPEEPKKVCVEEATTGSLFRRRICATQAEWDRRRERDSEGMAPGGDSRARSN